MLLKVIFLSVSEQLPNTAFSNVSLNPRVGLVYTQVAKNGCANVG